MDKKTESLLSQLHGKDVRELVANHVRSIEYDDSKKEIMLTVDKRYAMNLLQSSKYAWALISWLQKCFGDGNSIILHLMSPHVSHDREMLIPHSVHYR